MKVFNLAEELEKERKKNKELEKKIKHYEKTITFGDYVEELNTLIDYKDRIDKARIEMDYLIHRYYTEESYQLTIEEIERIMDILKGDNK